MIRRVVVTGLGLVNSLGINVGDTWVNILNSVSGVKKINYFDTSKISCKIAAYIDGLDIEKFVAPRDLHKMDKFIHYGIVAATEAIADSGWAPDNEHDQNSTGVIIGSGIGGLGAIENTSVSFHSSDKSKISPYFIPSALINLLPGHVAIKYGFSGPNTSVVTACSTGAHAIGDAGRIIKYGDADVMIAGGAEAPITPVGVAGFAAARSLAINYNDNPKAASRPWDKDRCGFVMGEGAAILVLEEYSHALKRGANIYAELLGYGLTGDAYHITAPSGKGAYRAMNNALNDAGLNPNSVDYINAHGTSTKLGDEVELNMVQKLFEDNKNISMSSTKSATGHLLGAAGSAEAIFSVLSLRDQVMPPTLNLDNPIDSAKINLVPFEAQESKLNYVLSNSFGFGGTNVSLIFGKI
ncbi:beta-ketoacyl-ACP synthase II [Rickettsia endosymbiont of Cardiosporidium cionae]|uniref:beta-ketoacyl-ACP synthase II n=1 Tax=Rickettsia endosymbiont of Cardiosporidium cionae TaxID=2777155 RepID=UPI001892D9AC|nr:beta-ketoacyl-ACP synthase II [Rickettsia endosymbiont of Cardiosporidium cionae]KAF8818616.1 beta-ketoacyl-[acyl-carrier-protein] synthase II [Rickettsia endosymbiont of Cardiosporidium cionae]